MDVARIREGIRRMRYSTISDRWDAGETTQETAAEPLWTTGPTFPPKLDRVGANLRSLSNERSAGSTARDASPMTSRRQIRSRLARRPRVSVDPTPREALRSAGLNSRVGSCVHRMTSCFAIITVAARLGGCTKSETKSVPPMSLLRFPIFPVKARRPSALVASTTRKQSRPSVAIGAALREGIAEGAPLGSSQAPLRTRCAARR